MPKALSDMAAEVAAYQVEKGWTEERSISASLELLHEEASEAGRAWRKWGLADHTLGVAAATPDGHWRAEPEGVGSELADVVIRLLDTSNRHGLGLPDRAAVHDVGTFVFAGESDFLDDINVLHNLISRASFAYSETGTEGLAMALLQVFGYVHRLARHYKFNLAFEYERKMKYNALRDFRHGGRKL
jgi:NTP pyrophosphatase (non-canonical NTP hydrolase)